MQSLSMTRVRLAMNAIENLVKDFEKEYKGFEKAAAKKVHKYLTEKAYR